MIKGEYTLIPFEKNSLILAPMAGITDQGFRKICKKYGADVTVSEMVSTKGIFYNDKKSIELLKFHKDEEPIVIQIFGHDIECIKKSTEFISNNYSPVAIDINMGCPAPKIFQNGDGSALMKNIELSYNIIKSVKENTDLPVSVKFRSGINDTNINAVDFARMCENAKADYITIHSRTREQFYSGKADRNLIKDVVESVNIPVIANGDIDSGESAIDMLRTTGAHSIMIGRGALGNPLIFNQIKKTINKNYSYTDKPILDIALEQLGYVLKTKPEHIAVKEFRKHLLWYFKGLRNAAKYKRQTSSVITFNDCKTLIDSVKNENQEYNS